MACRARPPRLLAVGNRAAAVTVGLLLAAAVLVPVLNLAVPAGLAAARADLRGEPARQVPLLSPCWRSASI